MTEHDAQDQLDFIKKVMEETRREITGDGVDFMQWGIIAVVGSFATYSYHIFKLPMNHIWFIWIGIVAIGWILSIRTGLKRRKVRATSYTGKIVLRIWGGCGIAMTILGFIGPVSGAYSPDYIIAVLSALSGAAYFASSMIFESRLMTLFAVGWWCGSILMFVFPGMHMMLLFGLMMLCFQVIPGYSIYKDYKKRIAVQE